jgi:excinuclease ABC subunit A
LVTRDSPDSIADEVLGSLTEGTRFYVLFPAAAGLSDPDREAGKKSSRRRAGESRQWLTAHLMSLMQRGFTRLFVDGQTIDLRSPDDYPRNDFKKVFVLVDRLTARPDVRQRLVDSLEICFQEGHGAALIETAEAAPKQLWFSERFECKYDHTVYATPEPRLFSFNNPFGACPTCQGFGNTIGLDLDLVIPNPGLSLKDGAIEPWTRPQHEWAMAELKQFCRSEKISMTTPFNQLSRSGSGSGSAIDSFYLYGESTFNGIVKCSG